jgi:hypothetical protein
VNRRFEHFAAIDWSGAVGARQKGIAVALCGQGNDAPRLIREGHIWSRADVLDWVIEAMPANTLVGFDLSPGFPFDDAGAYFPGWDQSPGDARALWALVDAICEKDEYFGAQSFVNHDSASRYFRRHGLGAGDRFGASRAGRLRVVEQVSRDLQLANPYSCLNLVGAAQVGKSSLTAMRMFHRMAGALPFWPFDTDSGQGSLMVEIYTSIAAIAANRAKGRSKVRSAGELDGALAALNSAPCAPLTAYTDHATDAIITAAWLRKVHADPSLWSPKAMTAEIATTEGWTFGVS